MESIYLDHNATTPVDPAVLEAMLPFLQEKFGNGSSLHLFGDPARQAVASSRETVADILGCEEKEVVFTGGATESDNHALVGVWEAKKHQGDHMVTSAIEHPAILSTAQRLEKQGADVTYVGVDRHGVVDPDEVAAALNDRTILVSIMYANNETGAVQPIEKIGQRVKARSKSIMYHTDAVQAAGKLPLDVNALGVDLMSLSGHKIYGPKGVGVLYVRRGSYIRPLLTGGHHENNRRAGTENVPGIVGFATALGLAEQRREEDNIRLAALRDTLQAQLLAKVPHLYVSSREAERTPNTLHVLPHFIEGEAMLLRLSLNHGIALSTGSACTSGSLAPSHVLDAMGLAKQLGNSGLRISLGRGNTPAQIERVAEAIAAEVAWLRAMSPLFEAYQSGRMSPEDRALYDTWTTHPSSAA